MSNNINTLDNSIGVAKLTFAVGLFALLITLIVQVSSFSSTFGDLRATVRLLSISLEKLTNTVESQALKHQQQVERYQERQLEQDRRIQNLESKFGGL